jgi:hypothetical protein
VKALKIVAILFLVYVGIVVAFESLIGYYQPAGERTLVITTTDEGGRTNDRVLARLDSNGALYVAANHWPRAWYKQALQNPQVQITVDGERGNFLAVPVNEEERVRLQTENGHGILFRILTGFPPRYFVRLDPR